MILCGEAVQLNVAVVTAVPLLIYHACPNIGSFFNTSLCNL